MAPWARRANEGTGPTLRGCSSQMARPHWWWTGQVVAYGRVRVLVLTRTDVQTTVSHSHGVRRPASE